MSRLVLTHRHKEKRLFRFSFDYLKSRKFLIGTVEMGQREMFMGMLYIYG